MAVKMQVRFFSQAVLSFASLVLIVGLLLGSARKVQALDLPPALPSSFYGEIHISDSVPSAGDILTVYKGGVQVASANIATYNNGLVYSIDVPGVAADEGAALTFQVGSRVVMTAAWHTATNVERKIHPPYAQVSYSAPANEGSPVTINAGATTDWFAGDIVTYAFDCNNDGTYETQQAGATTTCTFSDNGSYPVKVKVTDSQGGLGTASVSVTVNNVTPSVIVTGGSPVYEGGTFTGSGSFTDPGADSWTAKVNYGDGSGAQTLTLAGKTFSLSHTYPQDGSYPVSVTVTDDDTAAGTGTFNLTVTNAAPVVNAGPDAAIKEGSTFTGAGSFTDPGADTWSASVNYGDGGGAQALTLQGKTFSLSHLYTQNGAYTATVTVNDDDTSASDSLTVTVSNVAPLVSAGANAVLNEGDTLNRSVTFTDPGADTWTATIDYGDGSPVQGPAATGKTITLNHPYIAAGTHTVSVSVNDGEATASGAFTVTVNNITPTATFNAPAAVNEGSPISLSFTNPQHPNTGETLTYAFDCGSGYGVYSSTATASCPTTDKGSLMVKGKIRDMNGAETAYQATVAINDVLPSGVSAGGPYTVSSGTPLTLTGIFTCAAADTCTTAWDLDNNGSFETSGNPATSTWYPAGSYTVSFRVTDSDGNPVTAATTVAVNAVTQGITLQPGWNLVSFNLHVQNSAVDQVLSSIAGKFDLVYAWDATGAHANSGNWLKYDLIPESQDTLANLDEKMGFWIHVTAASPVTLTISGSVPTTTTITLSQNSSNSAGWNLVGFPAATDKNMPGALTGTGFNMMYAYHANDSADPWKMYDTSSPDWASDLRFLSPGWGYWVKVGADGIWTVTHP